ncbi:hypothetical protein QQF64_016429 [Cirrhinus molitorella]
MGRRSTSSCSGAAAAAIRAAGPPVQPPLTARDSHGRDAEGGGMETPPHSVNRSTDTTYAKQQRADRQSHPALMQQHTDERKHPERVEILLPLLTGMTCSARRICTDAAGSERSARASLKRYTRHIS